MLYFPEEPFDPRNLTPAASINRTVIGNVPWLAADLQGKDAYTLLGRESLLTSIKNEFLTLDGNSGLLELDALCLAGNSVAHALAQSYGERIAALVYVLKTGVSRGRSFGTSWSEAHWNYWKSIENFILAGGLMAGSVGRVAVAAAQTRLCDLALLTIPSNPRYMPLIGAAIQRPLDGDTRVVIDFGNTAVKSGLARYEEGELTSLQVFPELNSPTASPGANLLAAIVRCWRECGQALRKSDSSTDLGISLAAYVDGSGQPAEDSYIGGLYECSRDVPKLIANAVAEQSGGSTVQVKTIHDGTAAAAPLAGSTNTALITFGTALGRGAPPLSEDEVVPISRRFRLIR